MFTKFSRKSKQKHEDDATDMSVDSVNAEEMPDKGASDAYDAKDTKDIKDTKDTMEPHARELETQIEAADNRALLELLQNWQGSPETLSAVIALQIEKEKSKQEQLKLSNLNKSIELLQLAIHHKIPKQSIVHLFNSSLDLESDQFQNKLAGYNYAPSSPQQLASASSSISQPSTSVFKVSIPQNTQYQFHHWHAPAGAENDAKRQRRLDFATSSPAHKRGYSETAAMTGSHGFTPFSPSLSTTQQQQQQQQQPAKQQPWRPETIREPPTYTGSKQFVFPVKQQTSAGVSTTPVNVTSTPSPTKLSNPISAVGVRTSSVRHQKTRSKTDVKFMLQDEKRK